MGSFVWMKDKEGDWSPWPITIVARGLKDDCDGAAVLAKWHLKKNGFSSRIIHLFSEDMKVGHDICMVEGESFFVSNESIIEINNPQNWKESLFRSFGYQYTHIL